MDDRTEVAIDEPVGLAVDDPVGPDDPRADSPVTYPDEEMEHEWVESGDGEGLFDYREEGPGRAHESGEPEPEAPRHHEIAEEWDSHEPLDFHGPQDPAAARDVLDEEPLTDEHPPVAAAPPRDAAPPPSDDDGLDHATVEYDVEAEHRHEGEGEDVLEETPEFLHDTPDHDRLWFEQKPPRDFDLDG
jgi:hypothetical protein